MARSARAWPIGHALAVLVGLALIAGRPAQAGSAAPGGDLEIHLGFEGALKVGVPVPLDVTVPQLPSAGPARLIVDAPALAPQAGVVVTSTVVPFQAVAGTARTFHLPVTVQDVRRPLVIRVAVNGREALRRDLPIDPTRVGGRVIVALSDEHAGLESLHRLADRVVLAYAAAQTLPRHWQEYAAVDLLVIRDLAPDGLDAAQSQALATWVRLGGRLLVIAREGGALPASLQDVLPAAAGEPRLVSLAPLAARYGGRASAGPVAVTALVARPGAAAVRASGVPVIVSQPVGWGSGAMWAFDPLSPPFQDWSGHLRVWAEALGPPRPPRIDVGEIAGRFPGQTPLDPLVHLAAGAAIAAYIGGLFFLQRRRPPATGAASSVVLAAAGILVFAALAAAVRARSMTLSEATFLEQAPGASLAQATSVAVVAVPYGGEYRVVARPDLQAGPVGPTADIQIALTTRGTVLSGRLPPGGAVRAFRAVGTQSASASGWLTSDGRMLTVDLGAEGLHRAELRWRGRVYLLGDLPPGRSVRALRSEEWRAPAEVEGDEHLRGWWWRTAGREGADVIMDQTVPLLAGELGRVIPAFTLEDGKAPGRRLMILLVPLGAR